MHTLFAEQKQKYKMKNLILEKIAEAKESQKMIALLNLNINNLSFNFKDLSFDDIISLDEEWLIENNLKRSIDIDNQYYNVVSIRTSDYMIEPAIYIHFCAIK